jgi:uncharacterized protein (TIGR03067 family)
MQPLFFALVMLSPMFGTLSSSEDDQKAAAAELKKLTGTWQLVNGELAGNKFPEEAAKSTKLVIADSTYVVTVGEGKDEGTVRVMPAESPKAMDISGTNGPNKGRTFLAIYELDGDNLKVCYDLAGKKRPTEFKTQAGGKLFLAIYKRQKP